MTDTLVEFLSCSYKPVVLTTQGVAWKVHDKCKVYISTTNTTVQWLWVGRETVHLSLSINVRTPYWVLQHIWGVQTWAGNMGDSVRPTLMHDHQCSITHLTKKNLWTVYWNRGLVRIIPTQGVVQHSHRSVCFLHTEAPGRHSTQTRTQTSPVVA